MNIPTLNTHLSRWLVPALLLCLFLLLSSGRMDSGDANAELAASINLVQTGSLGTSAPYADPLIQTLFVQAPNGRYYEAHEIGNSLLLAPAAYGATAVSPWVAPRLGFTGLDNGSRLTVLIAKSLASLLETALSAIACFYLFLLFGLFYRPRPALILTALFVFATFYAAYFRTAWDVLPACNAVIVLLYYSAKLILAPAVRAREAVPVALCFGIVSMFRLSLAPFLGLGLLILLWGVRKRVARGAVLPATSIAIALFIPTLVFNAIRTGSPLRPANTLPQFQYQTGASGHMLAGMFGLLLSPNRGLFVFSPILLLLVLLPGCWRSLPPAIKSLLTAFLPGAFLYYLMIARLRNWGAAGWGPRYLLPVLPILFLGVAAIAYRLWFQSRMQRLLLITLCCAGFLLSVPTLLVNYSNAVLQSPDAFNGATPYPVQHIAVWKTLNAQLHGRPVKIRADAGSEEEVKLLAAFPDLLVMRLHQVLAGRSKPAAGLLLVFYLAALGCAVFLLWSQCRNVTAGSGKEVEIDVQSGKASLDRCTYDSAADALVCDARRL
jgi:hypothetical protein